MYTCTASHVSQFPSLNFLVYVPKRSESPLYIRSDSTHSGHSLTDNFLVPQWGGVIIHNQVEPSPTSHRADGGGGGEGGVHRGRVKMEKLMPVFVDHLKMLLGVPALVSSGVGVSLPALISCGVGKCS